MAPRGVIEIRIAEVNQLFNSLDPSPFPEKDLDHDAEEFIVSWATELPRRLPLMLRVHLSRPIAESDASASRRIADGVHTFFAYRAAISRLHLKRLLSTGRSALIIGLVFLTFCLGAANLLAGYETAEPVLRVLSESLLIGGWVAMWRPMEIFLYEWWPLRHERRVYDRLSLCEVEVIEQKSQS